MMRTLRRGLALPILLLGGILVALGMLVDGDFS